MLCSINGIIIVRKIKMLWLRGWKFRNCRNLSINCMLRKPVGLIKVALTSVLIGWRKMLLLAAQLMYE